MNISVTKKGILYAVPLLLIFGSKAFGLEFQTITGTTLSTTLIESLSIEESRFVNTVALHFANGAKDCWKQRVIPKQKTVDRITVCTILVCRRFWPYQPEKLCQFLALIISESGGNNTGNPNDPSFGVCHVTYYSAHHACQIWGIMHPKTKMCDARCRFLNYKSKISFLDLLAQDIGFNIECGAGEAAIADIKANHDWVRTVLIYKFGERGFVNALNRLGDQPITEMKSKDGQYVWKNYNRVYLWTTCLQDRSGIVPMSPCGCLPMEVSP